MTETASLSFKLNGQEKTLAVPAMSRLLDVLREQCQTSSPKEGCGEGECGACSVFLDGILVNSCLIPALQVQGRSITTIDGLGNDPVAIALKDAFLIEGGAQCGICTPGMLMAAASLLRETQNPSLDEIKDGLAGNLCRCTGYQKIFSSVQRAAKELCAGRQAP